MKTNLRLSHLGLLIPVFIIFASVFFTDCKGKAEIHDIIDSVINCEPPFIVYFFAEAEHRTKGLEYTWDFGDNQSSNEQEPVHTYNEFGKYNVSLEIRQNEAVDLFSFVMDLTEEATAPFAEWDYDIDATNFWAPCYMTFQNTSRHATQFLWEFDDGETSTEPAPIHIFEYVGVHNVTLNAICQQDTNKLTYSIEILPEPDHIFIGDVNINMPSEYAGNNIIVDMYYGNTLEETITILNAESSFTWVVDEYLSPAFTGFNTEEIKFEIWIEFDSNYLDYFSIGSQELQDAYYPNLISFTPHNNGFALDFELSYD